MYMLGSAGLVIGCIVVGLCALRLMPKLLGVVSTLYKLGLFASFSLTKKARAQFAKLLQSVPPRASEKQTAPAWLCEDSALCCKGQSFSPLSSQSLCKIKGAGEKSANEQSTYKTRAQVLSRTEGKKFYVFKIKLSSGKVVFVQKDKKSGAFWLV